MFSRYISDLKRAALYDMDVLQELCWQIELFCFNVAKKSLLRVRFKISFICLHDYNVRVLRNKVNIVATAVTIEFLAYILR